jgi:L-threonylcarbamoyladenylate synthase
VSNTDEGAQSNGSTAAESLEASGPGPVDDGPEVPPPDDPPAPTFERFDCANGDASQLFKAANAARRALEQGQCIVLPTDTVYGIGADAFSPQAVQRLLDAKIRGRDMPPPVLIADSSLMRVLAVDVPPSAKDLIERHWPGALTVICRVQPSLRLDLGDAEGTIALRVPDHDLAREILRQTGPMAVSSANLSGRPAAVTCDEAVAQLGNSVSVYLDGGRLGGGSSAPSTIVDFTQKDTGEVLRHGALTVEVLRETCPELDDLVEPEPAAPDATEPEPAAPDVTEPEPDEPSGQSTTFHGSHAVDLPVDDYPPAASAVDAEPVDPERSTGA